MAGGGRTHYHRLIRLSTCRWWQADRQWRGESAGRQGAPASRRYPGRHPARDREGPGTRVRKGVAEVTYRVVVTREGRNWLADVPQAQGAHTYADSLSKLDRYV